MEAKILQKYLDQGCTLQPLTPEASSRRYFRITGSKPPLIWVKSDQCFDKNSADILSSCKIPTPQLINEHKNGHIIEDCGDHHLKDDPSLKNYQKLWEQWLKFHVKKLPDHHSNFHLKLDKDLFVKELFLFIKEYVLEYRRKKIQGKELLNIKKHLTLLAKESSLGPQSLQHRDFHSKNILLSKNNNLPVWIDFQDMRQGPIFYDLASLYTDAYVKIEEDIYSFIREKVIFLGKKNNLIDKDSIHQFNVTALQRVLKALGTFGKLLNNGRNEYKDAEIKAKSSALGLCDQLTDYYDLRDLIR